MIRRFFRLDKNRAAWHKHNGKNGNDVVLFYSHGEEEPIELDTLDIEMILSESLYCGTLNRKRVDVLAKLVENDIFDIGMKND